MYRVKINYSGVLADKTFETEMPKIPTKDEQIGFWHGEYWSIVKIYEVVFEFDKQGIYLLAEINTSD